MRRFPVTLNPSQPATHTGIPPQLQRRPRTPVRQVLPAGQSAAYAGSVGSFSGASAPDPAPAPGLEPASSGDGCCG